MANHESALKRHRQSLKAKERNRAVKTRIKNVVKTVQTAIEQNDKTKALEALTGAASIIDKAASKKVIHWRKASRKISRLSLAINKLA